jgi:hypothetical protein
MRVGDFQLIHGLLLIAGELGQAVTPIILLLILWRVW